MLKIPLLFAVVQHPHRTSLRRLRNIRFFLGVGIFLLAHGLTTGYVAAQLQNGLVGYWSFDDGTGTIASDSSGNGNTAILVNGPIWTSGEIAGALSFTESMTMLLLLPNIKAPYQSPLACMPKRLRVTYFPEL